MTEIDPITGLPKELNLWEDIAREDQHIQISVVKRRYGKLSTLVEGLDEKSIDIKDLSKKLKSKFACGGTAKKGIIELQGNHAHKVKEELVRIGFTETSISVLEKQRKGK